MYVYVDRNVTIDNYQLNYMVDACIYNLKSCFGDVPKIDEHDYNIIQRPKDLYKIYVFEVTIDEKVVNKAKLTNYETCTKYFNEMVFVDNLLLVSGVSSTIRNYYIQLVNI